MSYIPPNRFNVSLNQIGASDPRYSPLNKRSAQLKKIGCGDIGYEKFMTRTFTDMGSFDMGAEWRTSPIFISDDIFICLRSSFVDPALQGVYSYKITMGVYSDSITPLDSIKPATELAYIDYANGRVFIGMLGNDPPLDVEINIETGIFGTRRYGDQAVDTTYGVSAHPNRVGFVGYRCRDGSYSAIKFFQDGNYESEKCFNTNYYIFKFFPQATTGNYYYLVARESTTDALQIYDKLNNKVAGIKDGYLNHARGLAIEIKSGGAGSIRYIAHFHETSIDSVGIHQFNGGPLTSPRYSQQTLTIDGNLFKPYFGRWSPGTNELFLMTYSIISRWSFNPIDLSLTLNSLPITAEVEVGYYCSYSSFDINFNTQRLLVFTNYLDASYNPFSILRSYKIN